MTTFEDAMVYAKKCLNVSFELSESQIITLKSLYDLRDTVAVLPTGSGKSRIFQLLPWMLQKKLSAVRPLVTLVVCPLNSIMQDQVASLCEKGIKAAYVNIDASKVNAFTKAHHEDEDESGSDEVEQEEFTMISSSLEGIKNAEYNIVYMHPETIHVKSFGRILRSRLYKELVCCTVIDEVHMISEWGTDFRAAFNSLGELTCLFPKIPHLALTATATASSVDNLIKTLQFENVNKIFRNPDRTNIYIEIRPRLPNIRKYEKMENIMNELLQEITEKQNEFPVTIVYCDNLETLGYCFQYLWYELGDKAYWPVSSKALEDRIIAQYHKDYSEASKINTLCELRKKEPKVRLVLATVALGMGLNSPSIQRIIHMRPPTTLEKYMQEIGRAGRNGEPATAICYFNESDIATNRVGLEKCIPDFIRSNSCFRKKLMSYFGYDEVKYNGPASNCCSNCRKSEIEESLL